jgi:hypothetical protein
VNFPSFFHSGVVGFHFITFDFIYFFLQIPMCGFGGHARLIAKGVPRDGAGRMWLMLHLGPRKTEWETSFLLQNIGDLKAFMKIKPILKGEFSIFACLGRYYAVMTHYCKVVLCVAVMTLL